MKPTILAAVLLMTPAAMAFNQPFKSGGGVSICVQPSCVPPAPGPGGALGLAAGWRASRRLRRRTRGVR